MCRNHQHLVANGVQGAILQDGNVVYIVEPALENVIIENSTGGTLTVPCSMIVLFQPHERDTVFSSPGPLMAGLVALSFAAELIASEDGLEQQMMHTNSSPTSSISFEPEEG